VLPFPSPWEPLQSRYRRARQRRWRDAVQELFDIQADYLVWLDNLPEGLKDSTIAERLREVCELDPSQLDAVLPLRARLRRASSDLNRRAGSMFWWTGATSACFPLRPITY